MIRTARSILFVPGDRAERFDKAAASGADLVVIDLEDAVLPAGKVAARDGIHDVLSRASGPRFAVRINALGTPWHADDVRALAGLPGLAAVMLPKAERASDFAELAEMGGGALPLHALVETVQGVANLAELCAAPDLVRLSFGTVDFQVDAGIDGDGAELDTVRSMLVLASRLAGLQGPVEGVHVDLGDDAGLAKAADRSRRFGMRGKLCVHPRQVPIVNAAFSPGAADIDWAHRVIAALDGAHGAVAVDGKLVDKPIVDRARAILAASEPVGTID